MKIKVLTAAIAALLIFPAFGTVAYAGGGPDTDEPTEETPIVEATPEPNPFTPAGTGTVIDNATDADGKEFVRPDRALCEIERERNPPAA